MTASKRNERSDVANNRIRFMIEDCSARDETRATHTTPMTSLMYLVREYLCYIRAKRGNPAQGERQQGEHGEALLYPIPYTLYPIPTGLGSPRPGRHLGLMMRGTAWGRHGLSPSTDGRELHTHTSVCFPCWNKVRIGPNGRCHGPAIPCVERILRHGDFELSSSGSRWVRPRSLPSMSIVMCISRVRMGLRGCGWLRRRADTVACRACPGAVSLRHPPLPQLSYVGLGIWVSTAL